MFINQLLNAIVHGLDSELSGFQILQSSFPTASLLSLASKPLPETLRIDCVQTQSFFPKLTVIKLNQIPACFYSGSADRPPGSRTPLQMEK